MMEPGAPQSIGATIRTARASRPLLLLCDFDGTLCEFRPDPAAVWLSTPRRDLLLRLSGQPGTTVGIVSGRRVDDIRLRSGLSSRAIFVAGLHGLEIEGRGERFAHPGMDGARRRAQELAAQLRPVVSSIPGAFTEDKDLSIAVHFRQVEPDHQALLAASFDELLRGPLAAGDVRVMRGSCVLEVLPNILWDKGHAVRWICDRVARDGVPPFTVYLGDDTTDEDAFRAITSHGLRIAASDRVTGADYVVDGPGQVEQILAAIAR
jgi:trehalose-phosphatase